MLPLTAADSAIAAAAVLHNAWATEDSIDDLFAQPAPASSASVLGNGFQTISLQRQNQLQPAAAAGGSGPPPEHPPYMLLPELLRSASFFLLPQLRAACLELAGRVVDTQCALPWLAYAHEHSEQELKQLALGFAAQHFDGGRRAALRCAVCCAVLCCAVCSAWWCVTVCVCVWGGCICNITLCGSRLMLHLRMMGVRHRPGRPQQRQPEHLRSCAGCRLNTADNAATTEP